MSWIWDFKLKSGNYKLIISKTKYWRNLTFSEDAMQLFPLPGQMKLKN
jgi:hypothetical protein